MGIDLEALRQQLAAIEHERWAAWQRWVHEICTKNGDGSLTIPTESVERWERQIATPYADLSEREQQSDMEQVDRYWPLIARHLGAGHVAADRAALVERIGDLIHANVILDGYKAADAIVSAVEATGWGPRAEPVAPPEPLSAGEFDHLVSRLKAAVSAGLSLAEDDEDEDATGRYVIGRVLAALPARFAVPVEGAR